MMRLVCLVPCFIACGCGLLFHDLLSQGVYRLQSHEVSGCKLGATAVERQGALRVEGWLRGEGFTRMTADQVEVVLLLPDGSEGEMKRSNLRLSRNRRASRVYAYFDADFRIVPPPGTVIGIRPVFPASQIQGCNSRQ